MDVMVRATNPYCAVVFEFWTAKFQPFAVEFIDVFGCAAFIPIAFVHAYLLTTLHADASVT